MVEEWQTTLLHRRSQRVLPRHSSSSDQQEIEEQKMLKCYYSKHPKISIYTETFPDDQIITLNTIISNIPSSIPVSVTFSQTPFTHSLKHTRFKPINPSLTQPRCNSQPSSSPSSPPPPRSSQQINAPPNFKAAHAINKSPATLPVVPTPLVVPPTVARLFAP